MAEMVKSVNRSGVKQVARHGSWLCSSRSPGLLPSPLLKPPGEKTLVVLLCLQPALSEGRAALAQEPAPVSARRASEYKAVRLHHGVF